MSSAAISTMSAMLLAQATATTPNVPFCGRVEGDIGRGFRVTQHLYDGSPEFTLRYQPPRTATKVFGVRMTAPFQFMFQQLDFQPMTAREAGLAGPHIGYTNYEFRKPDGTRLGTGTLKFDCGNNRTVNARFSADPPPDYVKVPITFHLPFLGQPERECLSELQRNGRYQFKVAERDLAQPSVVIEGRMPLKWAMAKVEKAWKAHLRKAKRGRCRLPARPPAPF